MKLDIAGLVGPVEMFPRIAAGLAVAAGGGIIAHLLHVPLAFMLGSLFACMTAVTLGAPIAIPNRLRVVFLTIVGMFLAESFTPETFSRLSQWPFSIAMTLLYVPVASCACLYFYVKIARESRLTALLMSIPGGFSAVVTMAAELKADERRVAISQSLRIAMIVSIAPAIAFGALGYQHTAPQFTAANDLSLADAAILAVATIVSIIVFSKLSAPLPFLVGPILSGAALRMSGVVEGDLPDALVEGALVVVGGSIGCRFLGIKPRDFAQVALYTLGGVVIAMSVAALFAIITATALDLNPTAVFLAFAPGGVAEMCLIAVALDADPSFVATHHLARILAIIAVAPFIAGYLRSP